MTNTFQKNLFCYEVKVKTTNSSNDTFFVPKDQKTEEGDGDYLDCEFSTCFVVTDNAAKIYEMFGDEVVVSVKKIGFGYFF